MSLTPNATQAPLPLFSTHSPSLTAAKLALPGLVVGLSVAALLLGGCAQPSGQWYCIEDSECADGETCENGACMASGSDGSGGEDPGLGPIGGSTGEGGSAESCGNATFELTETQEVFYVPESVSYMHVKAWGAGANGEGQCSFDDSGLGGFTEAVFPVTPGMPLIVIVGQRGRAGMEGEDYIKFGFGDWGGGGLSGVFLGPELIDETSSDRALIIAGGGGSAGAPGCHPGGTGNHPDAGGRTTMLGGPGADEINGGGGGLEGGLGGAKGEGALGGTGFVAEGAEWSEMLYSEPGSEFPPRTDDPDYTDDAGQGETAGRVVIHFSCAPPEPK